MKKPLQTLLVTSMVLTPTLLSIPMPHSVSAVQAAGTNEKEEKKDPEKIKEAKDKLKEETKKWKEDLPKEEQELLEDVSDKEKQKEINDAVKDKEKKGTKEWKEKIEKLDKVLEEAPKTETAITAYISIKNTKGLEKGGTFSEEGYLVGSDDIPDKGTDFAEVTIPAGESIIALENGDILTRRDSELTITEKPVTTVIAGDQVKKLEMTLLAKEKAKALQFKKDEKEKATTWGEQAFKEWKEKLTVNDKDELYKYSASWYDDINTYLRTGKLSDDSSRKESAVKERIKAIDAVLTKGTVPQDVMVYRRITEQQFGEESNWLRNQDDTINEKNATELEQKFKGKTFEQKSYMSTSLIQDPHQSFGNRQTILLEIKLPKGTHAGFLGEDSKLTKYPDQLELLVNRGYTFQYDKFSIVNPTKDGEKPYLKIEVTVKK